MIQQELTKTKMILITKTLVIFPLYTSRHYIDQPIVGLMFKTLDIVCPSRLLSLSQLSVYYFWANI